MKILVLGASGIIGQHMRLCVPEGVTPIWCRKTEDLLHRGIDLTDREATMNLLQSEVPNAIINLAGESRPDVVERDPAKFYDLNAVVPEELARWCQLRGSHYVHVSTQAVFSGDNPPYHAQSPRLAVNQYGKQKIEAEQRLERSSSSWTIARPTFVLGVRPMPAIGRMNPVEQFLTLENQKQVYDRFFSVSFARQVADKLWEIALGEPKVKAVHIGIPERQSRYDLARYFKGKSVEPVSHDSFSGIAHRPIDTTYSGEDDLEEVHDGLDLCDKEMKQVQTISIEQRAKELSIFTGKIEPECLGKLNRGFGALHGEVANDYRRTNPKNDDELLEWYRSTEAYLWELSAYHADAGFNYVGMCKGVADRLETAGAKRILCLGDGIGDLTLSLNLRGFDAIYHDLWGSQTAEFAAQRFLMYSPKQIERCTTVGWAPPLANEMEAFDAICSFDFLEHVTDVAAWVSFIKSALKPNGLFFAQNAFACGSGEDGSIPMHLARNDHWEKDWDSHLASIGLKQLSSNWYEKTSEVYA